MSANLDSVYSAGGLATAKIVRNSAASVLRFIASVPIPFLLVPFMLQQLGTGRFGVWALVSTLSAFVQLGDFGIGYALVKSVAEMKARNDIERLNKILSTALVLYTIIAGIMGLLAISVTGILISHVFRIPVPLVDEAEFVVMGTAIIFCVNLILSVFTSVINGIQRMDVSNGISFAMTIVNAIGVVVMLCLGQGLQGLVVNNGITTIGAGLVSWLAMRKLTPDIHLGLGRFRHQEVKAILTYGANIQITNLAGLAGDPLVKAIISSAAGVEFVAYYEIAVRLMNSIRFLFAQAIGPLMPFAAESYAVADLTTIVYIYRKSIRYIVLLALPLFALAFVVSPALMEAWVGPGYETSTYTFRIILIGQLVSIVSMPSYYIFLSTHVRFTMILAIANGLLDIVMCIGLGHFYGYSGVLAGFSLVMMIISMSSILLFCRTFHIRPLSLFLYVPLRSVAFSLSLAAFFWVLLTRWPRPGFFGLMLICLTFTGICSAFLWCSQSISGDEVRGLARSLKLFRS